MRLIERLRDVLSNDDILADRVEWQTGLKERTGHCRARVKRYSQRILMRL
jgi:hypothetical protein